MSMSRMLSCRRARNAGAADACACVTQARALAAPRNQNRKGEALMRAGGGGGGLPGWSRDQLQQTLAAVAAAGQTTRAAA